MATTPSNVAQSAGSIDHQIGYLGPGGSWTHQACLDLFDAKNLVPLERSQLFASYMSGSIDGACVPVTTSVVGATPYLDFVLDLPDVLIVSEYTKMLGYSLLALPGTALRDIKQVLAHPVALEEVKPWLDKELPAAKRVEAISGGAAALSVAESGEHDRAAMGPAIGAELYGLVSLVDDIEEGPHNVTRWWVLGRAMPAPSGDDKTSLLASVADRDFSSLLASLANENIKILDIYERPSKKTLDTHRYLIDVIGHAAEGAIGRFLSSHPEVRLLGSYPRRY